MLAQVIGGVEAAHFPEAPPIVSGVGQSRHAAITHPKTVGFLQGHVENAGYGQSEAFLRGTQVL